jgi:hypothetical protein
MFGSLSPVFQPELSHDCMFGMCVRCKELVCPCTPVLGISVKANDHPPPITSHIRGVLPCLTGDPAT